MLKDGFSTSTLEGPNSELCADGIEVAYNTDSDSSMWLAYAEGDLTVDPVYRVS